MPRRTVDRQQVATIACEAIAGGLPVLQTVAEVLDLTPTRAAYAVRAAKADGLIPEVRSNLEHLPTTAVIHRGSQREHTWQVCQLCLCRWEDCRGQVLVS